MSGPIPFIELIGDKFRVTEESKEYLRKITNPVGVVVVAGLYRTGKSYVLNKLVDRAGGFRVGNSVQACTKGLWIWGAPVEVTFSGNTKGSIIFMDTEGLGGPNATKTYDAQIMSLAVLLGSFFIYNSVGTIDQNAINDLALVLSLANRIKAKEREQNRSDRDIFPNFLWLLRDFALRLEDESGRTITPQQYFERSLVVLDEKSGGESAKSSNQMRQAIIESFSRRDCITLPRPTNEEADLQNLDTLSERLLRENFKAGIQELKRKVFSQCPIKRIMDSNVTGTVLLGIAEEYVKSINDGAIPNIGGAFEGVVFRICVTAYENALDYYKGKLDEALKAAPNGLEDTQLHAIHEKLSGEAYAKYRAVVLSKGEQEEKYHEKLQNDIRLHYAEKYQINIHDSRAKCAAYLDRIFRDFISPELGKKEYTRLDDVVALWREALDHYHREAIGPGKYPAYYQTTTNSYPFSILAAHNDLCDRLKRQHNDEVEPLRKRIRLLEEELAKAKETAELEKAEQSEKCKALQATIDRMGESIDALQGHIRTKDDAISLKDRDHQETVQRLHEHIDTLQGEASRLQNECDVLKNQIERLVASLQQKQKEVDNVTHSFHVQLSQLQNEQQLLTNDNDGLREECEKLRFERDQLNNELIDCQEKLTTAVDQKLALEARIISLEEQVAQPPDTKFDDDDELPTNSTSLLLSTPPSKKDAAECSASIGKTPATPYGSSKKTPRKSVGAFARDSANFGHMTAAELRKLLKDNGIHQNAKLKSELIELCIENGINP